MALSLLAARTDDVAAPHGASLAIVFIFIFLYHDMCLLMWLRIQIRYFITLFEEKKLHFIGCSVPTHSTKCQANKIKWRKNREIFFHVLTSWTLCFL